MIHAPPELAERMQRALQEVTGASPAERHARAGLACLRRAIAMGDERAAAFELLTADALLTEAAALDATSPALAPQHFVGVLNAPSP